MEYKSGEFYIKAIEDRTVTGLASIFGNVDSYGDIMHLGAFKQTINAQAGRVRHLWQHDFMQPPIATVKGLRELRKGGLPDEVRRRFPEATGGLEVSREYLRTPRADEVLEGIKSGAINEMSFGYDPVKWDIEEIDQDGMRIPVRNLREVRLFDTSDVNWGANPATVASKASLPYRDTGKAPESESWDRPALGDFTAGSWDGLTAGERRSIAAHYAWSANNPPEAFGDLKLGHHRPATSGVGPAVWRGVAAAMGALMGARGGVDIPAGDRRGVYDHLASHYAQFEKEPPDYKLFELSSAIAGVMPIEQIKAGRVLSARNLDKLKSALEVLTAILLSAEPEEDEKAILALTEQIGRRIEIAQSNYQHLFGG